MELSHESKFNIYFNMENHLPLIFSNNQMVLAYVVFPS